MIRMEEKKYRLKKVGRYFYLDNGVLLEKLFDPIRLAFLIIHLVLAFLNPQNPGHTVK